VLSGPEDEIAARMVGRMRAAKADREQVIDVLKVAFVEDRLTKDEFDARVGEAFTSRTYAELAALTVDLPGGSTAELMPREKAQRRARPSANADVKVRRAILASTAVTAGLWAAMLIAGVDDGLQVMLLFSVSFAYLAILALAGVVVRESRQQKRSGGQLPPRLPKARGQGSRRPASAARAEPRMPVDPGEYHAAERLRRPGLHLA
jgi:hypothetical protein